MMKRCLKGIWAFLRGDWLDDLGVLAEDDDDA